MADAPAERDDYGTWARLRRRKVVQWGIAYAAGAWGLLQGVAYLRDTFDWPHPIQQAATVLLLIGLPIALVLAWYHGDRGEQGVARTELAILTLLFLLGGALFWRFERGMESATNPAAATIAPAATTEARPSIAVLPFENRSKLDDDVFFVDGIHDDILTQLSKLSALKVISRTSVERFRKTELSVRQIAAQLGVKNILEGGVQRAGDRVRITVQLIDAATDTHLWAESYDRELTAANIFAIQSEVAMAIAAAMSTTLTSAEKTRVNAIPTRNLEAWEAYQLGQQRMVGRNSAKMAEAAAFYRKAIDLDPRFALAYAGLAVALTLQAHRGTVQGDAFAMAEKAIATALELDPNLAEAWAASGLVNSSQFHYERAETMFRRAIELNPNYANAYMWLGGQLLDHQGRLEEARTYFERAAALDPLSPVANNNLGYELEAAGRFDAAEAQYRKVMEIDPATARAPANVGSLEAYARNHFAAAVPLMSKAIDLDPANPWLQLDLANMYFDLGDDDEVLRITRSVAARWHDDPFVLQTIAVLAMYRAGAEASRSRLQQVLERNPRNTAALELLRNLDLQEGHYDAARRRYATAFPEFVSASQPDVNPANFDAAMDFALVLQKTGEGERARALLDGIEACIRKMPRLGAAGYGITDVQIFALRNQDSQALAALREAERAGWRRFWRYSRDADPNLASIRSEPEFKAIFADIGRDMARQRAELASRPNDEPPGLASVH